MVSVVEPEPPVTEVGLAADRPLTSEIPSSVKLTVPSKFSRGMTLRLNVAAPASFRVMGLEAGTIQ